MRELTVLLFVQLFFNFQKSQEMLYLLNKYHISILSNPNFSTLRDSIVQLQYL